MQLHHQFNKNDEKLTTTRVFTFQKSRWLFFHLDHFLFHPFSLYFLQNIERNRKEEQDKLLFHHSLVWSVHFIGTSHRIVSSSWLNSTEQTGTCDASITYFLSLECELTITFFYRLTQEWAYPSNSEMDEMGWDEMISLTWLNSIKLFLYTPSQ